MLPFTVIGKKSGTPPHIKNEKKFPLKPTTANASPHKKWLNLAQLNSSFTMYNHTPHNASKPIKLKEEKPTRRNTVGTSFTITKTASTAKGSVNF